MPDIASLGLQIDTSQVVDGKKALDQFAESSVKVDQAARSANGQMNDTAKIMRAQAAEARATAAANTALGTSSGSASIGAQLFIEKLQEQAAVLGMSRSQLAAYQAAQLGVSKEAEASIAKIKAYEDAIKAAADAKAEAAKQANVLTDSIKLLVVGYSALKVGEYIKDAALLAARYETLGVVTEVVGRNAGYTKVQMDTATDAIARQGITMIESRESATKLVQAHVDLKNATELARIAQDAAVIGHLNSSDAFDRLVNGISRGNVLILRNIGINVNLQTAYRQMAEELGKTAAELTENERVQARLNAVIERGADIAGTYEAAMDTAGKQITSMQRYTQDLKTVIGETFNETLTIAVMALTSGLRDANKEVSELSKNQQLHEWGRSLADVFVWVANKVGNATTLLQQGFAWADHKAAQDAIDAKYKALANENAKNSSFWDVGFSDSGKRLAAAHAAELAEENVAYLTQQAKLSSQYDAFAKAAAERDATITAKHKAEADARLKVDQDYAAKATALAIANAGKSIEVQQAAQMKLMQSVYVGTPTYRDTEGREPKPKVDKVESTELADRLARIQDEVNADKEMYEAMSRMEDAFHAAGKMGDEEYYQLKRDHIEAAIKDQVYGYNKQIEELRKYHDGTDAEAAKHAKQINDIEAKRAQAVAKSQDELSLLDAKEFLRKDAIAAASDAASNKYLSGLDQEAKKLEDANAAHESSRSAVERETIARLDLAIAYQKQFIAEQDPAKATAEEIAQGPAVLKYLEDVRAARARIAAGLDIQQSIQYKDKAADQAIKDWQRTGQMISDSLTDAFGKAGKAAGDMFKAYAQGVEGQLRAQKDLIAAKKLADDNPAKIEAINRAQLNGSLAQIKSYADMTTAAQGFFAEGSRGYQAMHAASVLLHSAEVALSLIKGVNAVLTQGEGDPYSAFGRMAAMAAIVTGLGVALSGGSGGGGGQSAADVQKAQGTGTVFGDSSAKSDSIRRSIEQLTTNSNDMLPINQGMLTALQNIESAMTGLTNLVVRTPGLTDGSSFGVKEGVLSIGNGVTSAVTTLTSLGVGKWTEPLSNALASFWGKTTQKIVDSGLQYGGSIRSLQQGIGFDQYASVDTTKSSFFGLSKKTSNRVEVQGLNDELSKQFGLIFTNLDTSLRAAATAMGGSAADVTKVLDNLTLESTKVSLKGLTGTALTDALNSVISKSMDEIAAAAFPQLDQFRKVGEGYAETVIRLAGDYAKLDSILAASGTTFGATGIASIAARGRLIELVGGIDKLANQANSFNQNFLTKAEQLAPVQKYVTDQLAAMGLQSLDTRDKFKDYVLGLANSGALATEAGAQQYAALLALADAFAKTHKATEDLTKSEQEIADERKDLQQQYDELTLNSIDLYNKQRLAIDASNRALADQVNALNRFNSAKSNAQSAYESERSALQSIIDKRMQEADATKKLIDSLNLGDLSTLSPEQKYLEAQRQFDAASTVEAKNAAAQTLLQASRAYNGSTDAYSRDYAKVQGVLATQLASQKSAASIAQQQLDVLDKMAVDVLGLDKSTDTLTKAVQDFQKATLELGAAMIALAGANQAAGRPGDSGLADKGQSAVLDVIDGLYVSLLGRHGEQAGLDHWLKMVQGGMSYDQLTASFIGSDEYKALHPTPHAQGGLANGWSLVGEEGPELVNFGQTGRVYTASQTRAALSDSSSSAEVASLLKEVIAELRSDKTQRGAVGVATLKKLDTLAEDNVKLKRELARA